MSPILGYSCVEWRPQVLLALKCENMKSQQNANPILPAPGVSRTTDSIGDIGRPLVDRQNEVGSLNQVRREPMENSSQPRSFLRCRHSMKIATFNVNTIRSDNKREEKHMWQINIKLRLLTYKCTELYTMMR